MLRSLAPLLGCGVMMLVCMAVMAMAGRNRDNQPTVPPSLPASSDEIAALREEVARLRAIDDERRTADEPAP